MQDNEVSFEKTIKKGKKMKFAKKILLGVALAIIILLSVVLISSSRTTFGSTSALTGVVSAVQSGTTSSSIESGTGSSWSVGPLP